MIGVYDSGIGGLSVWKELNALMPGRDYAYVADSAHCPYGEKSSDYIIERADRVVRFSAVPWNQGGGCGLQYGYGRRHLVSEADF